MCSSLHASLSANGADDDARQLDVTRGTKELGLSVFKAKLVEGLRGESIAGFYNIVVRMSAQNWRPNSA